MALQGISSPISSLPGSADVTQSNQNAVARKNREIPDRPQGSRVQATMNSEYLSVQKYAVEFTSKDGDKVSFSMESIEYQKASLSLDAEGSREDMKKIVDFIKDEYGKMRKELVNSFLRSTGVDIPEESGETASSGAAQELNIPEYWNAENTSQRIVDFATQFFGSFKGKGEEFVKMMKDAIDKGFGDAKEMLGAMPEAVSKLTSSTYDLVMQKLDSWARESGVGIDGTQMSAAA